MTDERQAQVPEVEVSMPSDRRTWIALALLILPAGLIGYAVSGYSYLLFHSIVEMLAAIVAGAVFLVTWHSRRFLDNDYVGVVGTAFLSVAAVSVLHTLSYKGMGAFVGTGTDLPTQLWLVTRYLTAGAFLAAPFFIRRRVDLRIILAASLGLAAVLTASILLGLFPHAFIEGQGLTPFKIGSEYAVVAVLAISAWLLYRERAAFDPVVLRLLLGSIAATIGAELAFTLYQDPYGLSNLVGHLLLGATAFLVYRALVRTALEYPYALLFRRLKQRESALAVSHALSESLNRAAAEIGSTLDFDEIMRRVVVVAAETLSADGMAVSITSDDGWVVLYAYGDREDMIGRAVSRDEGRHMTEATSRRDVLTIADVQTSELVNRSFLGSLGVRALATVPLVARDEPIGVMSFHYRQPRDFQDVERDFIRKLASLVSLATENARLYATEHEIAERLQAGLTSDLQDVPGLEIGASYTASPGLGRIGGDFFDVFPVAEDRAVFLIGDVAGKGLAAATMTATVRGGARALAQLDPDPVHVMNGLNQMLRMRTPEGSFVTLLYGLVDTHSGRLELAVAGHPLPYLSRPDGLRELRDLVGPPLGAFAESAYHSTSTRLEKGDLLVMYTDGVIDARDCGEPLGEEGATRIIRENQGADPSDVAHALARAASGYASDCLLDDIAVLALLYRGV